MADGKGCQCAAYDKSECACDADWTPQELIDARAEIVRLRLTDAEREALHHVVGDVADITGPIEDTLRGLLERTK